MSVTPPQHPLPFWTVEEKRLVDRLARAVVAGRYRWASAAIADFRLRMARAGRPSRRTDLAIQVHISRRAAALGRRFPKARWTARELRIIGRLARALVAGKYANAGAAADDCLPALARAGLGGRHPRSLVRNRIIACAHEVGLSARIRHWTRVENEIVARFARSVIRGEYAGVRPAARECARALGRDGLPFARDPSVIRTRIRDRCRAAGWKPQDVRLTADEKRIIDHYAQELAAGRIANAALALPPCRRELARLGAPVRRTDRAILHRLHDTAHALGWDSGFHRWTPPELNVLLPYVRALKANKYPSSLQAAEAGRNALRKAGLGSKHPVDVLAEKLRQSIPGWRSTKVRWKPDEVRVMTDFARAIHDGRYLGVPAALGRCCRELSRLWRQSAAAPPTQPRHTRTAVRMKLWELAFRLGPRPLSRWCEAEERVLDRYARAVAARECRSITQAARLCRDEISQIESESGTRLPIRSLHTVQGKLSQRAVRYGRKRRIQPLWSSEERRISAKWTRRWDSHKRGRSRFDLNTLAAMMRSELRRHGFRRTLGACSREILKRYEAGDM